MQSWRPLFNTLLSPSAPVSLWQATEQFLVELTMWCLLSVITTAKLLPTHQAAAAVGGDVCPLRVCSEAEARHNCSLWLRSGQERRPCTRSYQLYVEADGAQPRRKCGVCGVSPDVHILHRTAAYPPFPPRTTPTFCAVAGDAVGGEHWPRVSTVDETTLRRRRHIQHL